jgi:tRNA uridine 5-carboxymethylaminomethyl modification enzyme
VLTNGTFLNGLIHIGEKTIWRRKSRRDGMEQDLMQFCQRSNENRNASRVDGRSLDYKNERRKEDASRISFPIQM